MATPERGCRSCHSLLDDPVLDLGPQPLVDEPLSAGLARTIPQAPVVVRICTSCSLVQLDPPDLRDWLATGGDISAMAHALANTGHGHARRRPGGMADHLAEWAKRVLVQTSLGRGSLVVDVASGDGGLLEHFRTAGLTVLGHESTQALADAANAAGIRTTPAVFGGPESVALMDELGGADLILANHALAHVDDLDAMVAALERCLAPAGSLAIEFLDLTAMVARAQFDVIGHAHRSYLSLTALERLLARHGLRVADARRSTVHGGAIQAIAQRRDSVGAPHAAVARLLARDASAGLEEPATFSRLGEHARLAGSRLRRHLEAATRAGRLVVGYGAPGRAVALLAIADVGPELLPFTVDRDAEKHGLFLPGAAVEIRGVEAIDEHRPAEVLILAWTWAGEIASQLARVETWGGRLVVPLPRLRAVGAGHRNAADTALPLHRPDAVT